MPDLSTVLGKPTITATDAAAAIAPALRAATILGPCYRGQAEDDADAAIEQTIIAALEERALIIVREKASTLGQVFDSALMAGFVHAAIAEAWAPPSES